MTRHLLTAALLLTTLAALACGDRTQVKEDPTPPQVQSDDDDNDKDDALQASDATLQRMRVLRANVDALNPLLGRDPASLSDTERAQILDLLAEMNEQVDALIQAGQTTGHANLDASLDQLKAQVQRAQTGAQASPPDYFEAAGVAAACLNCHGS